MIEPKLERAELKPKFKRIDHVAIAVKDLDRALKHYVDVLGFELVRRRTIVGQKTGMISAEIECDGIKFVLCQGTEPESQVSQLIEKFGPGVAHIAFAVDNIEDITQELKVRGMQFDTTLIAGSGLKQIFSSREDNCGMSYELIERSGEHGFLQENVQDLFAQLEKSGAC